MSRILPLVAALFIATAAGCQKAPLTPVVSLPNTSLAAQETNGPTSHKLTGVQQAEAYTRIYRAFPSTAVSNLNVYAYKKPGLNLMGKFYVMYELTLKTEAGSENISGMWYTPGDADSDLVRSLTKAQKAEVEARIKKTFSDEKRGGTPRIGGIDRLGKLFADVIIELRTGPREIKIVYYTYDFQTKAFTERPADKK